MFYFFSIFFSSQFLLPRILFFILSVHPGFPQFVIYFYLFLLNSSQFIHLLGFFLPFLFKYFY
jgi:hypothetical protein